MPTPTLQTSQDLLTDIRKISPELVKIRRQIHAHPELAFEEVQTSNLVAAKLSEWGYQVERGIGGTGLVGQLRRGKGTQRLGLRADMDALPIVERTGLSYSSTVHGKMHACGHDGHTAILLCAAKYLAEHGEFNGTLNLIFQPAEENEGGALRMVEEGLFERYPCDSIYALHNAPGLPVGHLAISAGPTMASFDRVTIELTGVSAHGAMPHHGVDPMQCAASIVLGLQSLVSREVDAQRAAVITVGSVQCGEVYNIVPERATLKIGVRTLEPQVREQIERRIKAFVQAQAQSYGLDCSIEYLHKYPVLVNRPEHAEFVRQVAIDLVGSDKVTERAPTMGSEDFAYMLQSVPGAYVRLGNGLGKDGGCMVHNPGYDFNDEALPTGAAFWVRLAQARLV
ncbi:M20 family metallopeptidase [Acidovorax sp. Be4]|uniref:M20 family metallopeptidase n=1 Tax=Acidovorax bellezanensis TaxID=2976702 RepID=A0ABT2PNJ5_9BURK|nr:M20 aminoacylase family protein [Acidovorax sp. Be4]MCT9812040.1 M20 family metallopeptidase [Acidovorax sp. Be4]